MKVNVLRLRNFRNISQLEFHPQPGLNFLIGANAQGKTSILEAVHLISTLRSFRSTRLQDTIQWGNLETEIQCEASSNDDWKTELKLQITQGERNSKKAFTNNKYVRSTTDFLKQTVHSIVFNPADHDLIQGEPKNRRSFLDQAIAAENPNYWDVLKRYFRIVEQRNILLSETLSSPNAQFYDVITQQLIEAGSQIMHSRFNWLKRLANIVNTALFKIAPNQSEINVVYLSKWIALNGNFSNKNKELNKLNFTRQEEMPSLQTIQELYQRKLNGSQDLEWRLGTTLYGPHRDDWCFMHNDQPLKGQGSQGEVRSALLALKLSEIELFRERTEFQPVLLLDDFSSELDQTRRAFLLDFLLEADLQVFVTTTEELPLFRNVVQVVNGRLENRNVNRRPDRLEHELHSG